MVDGSELSKLKIGLNKIGLLGFLEGAIISNLLDPYMCQMSDDYCLNL